MFMIKKLSRVQQNSNATNAQIKHNSPETLRTRRQDNWANFITK